MKKYFLLFTLYLMASNTAQATEEIDDLFVVERLSDSTNLVSQRYGSAFINFGVVEGHNYSVLITSMMSDYATVIEKMAERLSNGKPIKYVINIDSDPYQHHANKYFADKGATIISHANMRQTNAYTHLTFQNEISLDVGTEHITIRHTPAHTNASAIVRLENSNVTFMGDAFRNDWLIYAGPNGVDGAIKGLNTAISLSDENTKFIPGNRSSRAHSPQSEITAFRDSYSRFAQKVQALSEQGMGAENIARHDDIHKILQNFERYDDFKPYIIDHVKEIAVSSTRPSP